MHPHLDQKTKQLIERTNRVGIEFLLADLNTGLTFLQIASVTGSCANRTRNFDKAFEVYRTVVHLLPKVTPLPAEQMEINRKLEDLKYHLEEAGVSCNM